MTVKKINTIENFSKISTISINSIAKIIGVSVELGVEVGSFVTSAGDSVPTGYLECNGSAVSRTTYAALFSAIGTAWGSGNGSTTFHLPDLRGRFLRNKSNGVSTDPDRDSRVAINTGGNTGDSVGSLQSDEYKSHNHTVSNTAGSTSTTYTAGTYSSIGRTSKTINTRSIVFTPATVENRPLNANVMFIIKY